MSDSRPVPFPALPGDPSRIVAVLAIAAVIAGPVAAGDGVKPSEDPAPAEIALRDRAMLGRRDLTFELRLRPEWRRMLLDLGSAAEPDTDAVPMRLGRSVGHGSQWSATFGDRFPEPVFGSLSFGGFQLERMPDPDGGSAGAPGLELGSGFFFGGDGVYKYFNEINGMRLKFDANSISLRAARRF